MNLGIVIGTARATARHASLAGSKLVIVQPLAADGRRPDGEPVLAVDQLGAGRSSRVIITSDGACVQEILGDKNTPVRFSVLGIRDR